MRFVVDVVKGAIREVQAIALAYTYKGFVDKFVGAGCAGYIVSSLGRRVVYFGRSAEVHAEYFPAIQKQQGRGKL